MPDVILDGMELPAPKRWWDNPPQTAEAMMELLTKRAVWLNSNTEEGEHLRLLLAKVQEIYEKTMEQARLAEPIAFFKPSYEQALMLNAWVWGITFPICFAANRIGKTTVAVINALLWLLPNNPQWVMFKPYTDHYGRKVQVLPRPPLPQIRAIQKALKARPDLYGDPKYQPYDIECAPDWDHQAHLRSRTNEEKLATLQKLNPALFLLAWPAPPLQESGQIWLGAPDMAFHQNIIFKRWIQWLPQSTVKYSSDNKGIIIISTQSPTNPKPTAQEIVCKSYESEDTKWSGDAVHGIVLTEGLTTDILSEVKLRLAEPAFASWDYTPYEARNVGKKTALAHKVYIGQEPLPLQHYVWTHLSARHAPDHIIPQDKRLDMIKTLENRGEGKARLDGDFYSSSGLVLDKLQKEHHCLDWTFKELQDKIPNLLLFRGIDPGYDHPTVCVWAALAPNNTWFVYRVYSERNRTISQRCADIIRLSGNLQEKHTWGRGESDYYAREVHPEPYTEGGTSEMIVQTPTDFKLFKRDERTGQAYATNYIKEGLLITESIHMAPEDRAMEANKLLDFQSNKYHTNPQTGKPPGARVYFLTQEPGVANMLEKFDNLFWDRLKSGENKGEPKDKVPVHGDDELDALCYVVCGPYRWHPSLLPKPIRPKTIEHMQIAQESFQWVD